MIQAHGSNKGAECAKCSTDQDREELDKCISKGEIMYCKNEKCGGPVTPKIVFFGEGLPVEFMMILPDLMDKKKEY